MGMLMCMSTASRLLESGLLAVASLGAQVGAISGPRRRGPFCARSQQTAPRWSGEGWPRRAIRWLASIGQGNWWV